MTRYLKLKQSNCKNCYKCIRNCPVKSIRFFDNQANIVEDECILCGRCFVVCPQNAKEIRNDLEEAKALIRSGKPVYASIAPSFVACYDNATIGSVNRALKRLGFAGAEETAIGATIVKQRYDEMVSENTRDVIISSCCPTVNLLLQKYYPPALPYLAHVVSPMQAHCMDMKRRFGDIKTVFIGPCISKKAEAADCPETVNCALTFEELSMWLDEERITHELEAHELESPESSEAHADKSRTRLFPTAGGILRTMVADNPNYTYMAVDGIENCIQAVEDILEGNITKCFIEMSACAGSCIGGPAIGKNRRSPVRENIAVNRYAGSKDFDTDPYSASVLDKEFPSLALRKVHLADEAIEEILRKLGKTKPEHELNCGTCGYNTCREKAFAVLQGKADLSMCLPYLKEKAESFSDTIIGNTPNAIIVLSESFEVQQINAAACQLMRIQDPKDVLGKQAVCIIDPFPFIQVYQNEQNSYNKRVYLAEYQKYVEQTVLYDKSYRIIICIMRDVTEETKERDNKEKLSRTTIEITDKVIEKQMRAVQEIASLLGETTAETKIALTRLKESLKNE